MKNRDKGIIYFILGTKPKHFFFLDDLIFNALGFYFGYLLIILTYLTFQFFSKKFANAN